MKIKIINTYPMDRQANYFEGDIIEADEISSVDMYITLDGHIFTPGQVEVVAND